MSTPKVQKLGTFKLNEAQKLAIAQMVESEGFKVWVKHIVPQRAIQISGALINLGMTESDLWYYKGMGYENSKQIKVLEDIANDYNKKQLDADSED